MDRPAYYTKHFYSFLKDELQRHTDDYNWAVNKRQNLLAELDRLSPMYIHKIEKLKQEITLVQNQIDIFERLVIKSKQEITEYEEKHRTSTQANKYRRYSLAQRRAWAKGGRNSRKNDK